MKRKLLKYGFVASVIALVLAIVGATIAPALASSTIDDSIVADGVQYSPGEEVVSKRGRNSRVFYEGDGAYRAEFVGSPEFTNDDGEWVDYVFTDVGDYYQVQHAWSSARFYDYYTEVWNEEFTEVRVYDDRWSIEYLNAQSNWTDADFYSITRSYEVVSDGIKLVRTGNTDIGQRVDTYFYRNGSPCKIEIEITPAEVQTVRYVWRQSGIVASGELSEIDEATGKTEGMRFTDSSGESVWICRWVDELNVVDDVNVVTESHAQGRKATVTFESISVVAGQPAILDPDTFYPDVDPETDSVDGIVSQWDPGATWDSIQGDVGDGHNDIAQSGSFIHIMAGVSNYSKIERSIFLFDTDALPDAATISSAIFSIYGTDKADALSISPTINVYSSAPASDNNLVNGDYDSLGTTEYSTGITYAAWNSAVFNDFTLSATGRAAINLTGVSKFGVREATYDAPDSNPLVEGDDASSYFAGRFADYGVGFKPKLVVTYSVLPDAPTNVDATDGDHTDKVVVTWTKSDGATKYQVYRDASPVGGELGDVATFDDTGATAGTITNAGTVTASDGTSTAHVTLSLAGESTANGTTHTYKVRAGNASGWSGDSNTNTGYRSVGTITYQWWRSDTDDDSGLWLSGWDQRIKLTIDSADISGALSDFPILIYISADSGRDSDDISCVFDELTTDENRKKIAVTTEDGLNECYVEIEKWDDANEKAWLWIKVPSISSSVDTNLYLYYDVDHANNTDFVGDTNSTPAENVWDEHFMVVYHMSDGIDNANVYDSTDNNNDGAKTGANEPNEVSGDIGEAQDFDGNDDGIDCGADATVKPAAWTVEALLKYLNDAEDTWIPLITWKSGSDRPGISVCTATNTSIIYLGSTNYRYFTVTGLHDGGRHYIAYSIPGAGQSDIDNCLCYLDGVSVEAAAPNNSGTQDAKINLYIGLTAKALKGPVDEFRLSDVVRTSAWIEATYESSWDDLLAFGSEESSDVWTSIGGATTDPYNDTGAPSSGDGRYFRCVLSSVDASNSPVASDSNRGFRAAPPTVTTQAATNIEDTTATGNGNITAVGSEDCTIRGVVWDLATHGDPGNVAPASSGYANDVSETPGPFGVGAFTRSLTSLSTGDTIYARAYAYNPTGGYSYGGEINFLTKPAAPTDVDASDGTDETKVVITWTKSAGATDYHVWRGAVDLGSAGDVATFDDSGATMATIDNAGTVTASDGTEAAHVTLSLAGESTNTTSHTYKVVASNATGDSDDSDTDNGYRGVGSITYQWQMSDADSDADYNTDLGTTDPYNATEAPAGIVTPGAATATDGDSTTHVTLSLADESVADGEGRYYRCIVSASGASNSPQTSDTNRGYRTTGSITYQWQRSSGTGDSGFSPLGGATTDPYDDTDAPAGVITPGTADASDETSTAHVTLSVSSESVADGEVRYYYCEVSATGTATQDSTHNDGYRTTGSITYQWERSAADSDTGYSTLGGATTDPYDDTTAPAPTITAGSTVASDGSFIAHVALSLSGTSANVGDGRYYRCVLSATGTSNQTSTSNRGNRDVGPLTYQWKRSDGDSDANYNTNLGTNSTYDDTGAPTPTITAGNTVATDGTETAHVALSLSGTSANVGDGRYYICDLTAAGAGNQTSATNRGYRGVGSLNYQWRRSAGPSDASYSDIIGATSSTYDDVNAPQGSITNAGTVTASVSNSSYVTLTLASEATVAGEDRYYKCDLTATGASPQTSVSNDGNRSVGAITYQWRRSAADSDADYSNIGGGTTDPYNDAAAPAGTITPGTATASDGIAEAYVALVVSGHSVAPGAGRYFECVISSVDASNTPQTSNNDRGYRTVGAITYTWQRSDADSDAAYNTDIGTTNPYNDTSAPSDGSGRWYRALLDATGAVQTETTHNRGYKATSGYEQLITGDDADGDDIYGVNWADQQFTAGSVSHTLETVRVNMKRVGSPGTVTLSLRYANDIDEPIGVDLSSGTLEGDSLSTSATWYEFDLTDINLEADDSYALVMRAPYGTAADYIAWRWDSGGGLANAVAGLSTDAGVSWTVDSGEADYLFEVRGGSLIEMIGAQVFSDYIETGDWLVALVYENEYVPYYPNENSADYFYLQLLDGIVVEVQVNCPDWGYKPGSIYIAPSIARTLEWGATDYTVRLYGDFGANPASEYLIEAVDWRGANLALLDSWVISQARAIGADMGVTLIESVADLGEVLNEQGHTMFSIGIPELNEVRPELFTMVSRTPTYEEATHTQGLQGESDWETRLGPQLVVILNNAGDLIGQDGETAGGIIVFIAFVGVFALLSLFGHPVIGLSLGYPVLLAGAWNGVVSWVIIGVVTFLMAIIFVWKVFFTR